MVKRKVNGNWDLVLPAKKRNKTEQAFVEYVESLSDLSEVSAKDYAIYSKSKRGVIHATNFAQHIRIVVNVFGIVK
ncbi:hypothetical protein BGX21_002083 [Mortierella sp. AD011]|nr:hypothetical protein BGX21_002083 [Mortierella sp. AD011]